MTTDETEIRALIDRWSKAVRDRDLAGIRRDHADDMLMFDVTPPFESRGIDAYMTTWQPFFDNSKQPVEFAFEDVEVTASADVAFATAIGGCVMLDGPVAFRLTMCLHKRDGRWIVAHEHHSVPVE